MREDGATVAEQQETLIRYWMEKSEESLASAVSEFQADRLSTSVRATYYACFYAFSAVLWREGKAFKKHSAVRGVLHRDFIKSGRLDPTWGRLYDVIFDSRQRGDYQPFVEFDVEQVEHLIDDSHQFVEQMKTLLTKPAPSTESPTSSYTSKPPSG